MPARSNPFPASSRSTGERTCGDESSCRIACFLLSDVFALDGVGRNGTYTKHFLRHVKSDLEVGIMLRRVRTDVKNETAGSPGSKWESGSIEGEFYFNAGVAPKPATQPQVQPIATPSAPEPPKETLTASNFIIVSND